MLYIAICDDDEKMIELVKTNIITQLKEKVITAEITAYVQSREMQ